MGETFFQIGTWVTMALGMIGMHLNAKGNRWGFAFWMFTNTVWVVVGIYKGVYAQSAQHAFYFYYAVVGFVMWTQRERDHARHSVSRISQKNNPSDPA